MWGPSVTARWPSGAMARVARRIPGVVVVLYAYAAFPWPTAVMLRAKILLSSGSRCSGAAAITTSCWPSTTRYFPCTTDASCRVTFVGSMSSTWRAARKATAKSSPPRWAAWMRTVGWWENSYCPLGIISTTPGSAASNSVITPDCLTSSESGIPTLLVWKTPNTVGLRESRATPWAWCSANSTAGDQASLWMLLPSPTLAARTIPVPAALALR
mmetsp:Transcript_21954/g.48151  ORF Transcript_21954/g.48151 Transcript_21954/m.48151 type:complete len:214 (-) Transcript_21954:95-736(-)